MASKNNIMCGLIILILSNPLFGQKALFDTLKIDSSTKIIGRYSRSDKNKKYAKYNFIIEDSVLISKFIRNLELGNEVFNSIEEPNFKLSVVKHFDELGFWTINPTQRTAMTHDGHTYAFDLNQLNGLNNKYPFEYYWKRKVFHCREDYNKYFEEQKRNTKYLFDYAPAFRFEGSFEIEFERSEKYSSPKAISEYLEPYIEKIVNENQYRLIYSLNKKNRNNSNQFTMTLKGPRKLYERLKVGDIVNKKWKSTVEDGYFFYMK